MLERLMLMHTRTADVFLIPELETNVLQSEVSVLRPTKIMIFQACWMHSTFLPLQSPVLLDNHSLTT